MSVTRPRGASILTAITIAISFAELGCAGILEPTREIRNISVTLPATELAAGATLQASANVEASRVTTAVRWRSSSPTIASVDPTTGVVTAVSPGRAVLVCAVSTWDTSKYACASVDVYTTVTAQNQLRFAIRPQVPDSGELPVDPGASRTFKWYSPSMPLIAGHIDEPTSPNGSSTQSPATGFTCEFVANVCAITAHYPDLSIYSATVANFTGGRVYLEARRYENDGSYACVGAVESGSAVTLPYFRYFFGDPSTPELRVWSGSSCSGTPYDVSAPSIDYVTNPAGAVDITLTRTP